LHHHNQGCLTLRVFRRVSTTDLDTMFIRQHTNRCLTHPCATTTKAASPFVLFEG
jgi:hypothetical protein